LKPALRRTAERAPKLRIDILREIKKGSLHHPKYASPGSEVRNLSAKFTTSCARLQPGTCALVPPRREPAPPLPEVLKAETPFVKLLYLWLSPQGEVSYSNRAIAEALGVYHHQVNRAIRRLRALRLIEDVGQPQERVRSSFKAVPK
jgi:hypothetical protein